jgi:hypothetical protein
VAPPAGDRSGAEDIRQTSGRKRASRDVTALQREKALKGETHGRLRDETSPEGAGRREGAERVRNPGRADGSWEVAVPA